MTLLWKKEWFALLFFAVLIGVFYGNTLQNGFIYDDFQQIVDNEYIHSLRYLPKVTTGCTWEYAFGACKDRALYYRPVQSLSYFLTWQFSSDPWIFHLVNLVYFFAVVSLIFLLGLTLTSNLIFSFVAAFLFAIHPVNSETVNWAAAVPELTFAVFVLLSVIFFLRYRKAGSPKKFWLAACFYFLAMLSKEPAVLLPALFLLIDWRLFKFKPEDFLSWRSAKDYLILGAPLAIYGLMRFAVLGSVFPRASTDPLSVAERIYSFFFLFARYLKKLFYPNPLLFFHDFERKSNFVSVDFLFAALTGFIFLAAAAFLWKKKRDVLLFAFGWLFLFLLPVLLFIDATGESVSSDRYLFVPGIGFSLVIGYVLAILWQRKPALRFGFLWLLVILGVISWQVVYQRNKTWRDNMTIYTDTLAKNPDATPIRFNYAVLLRNEKTDFKSAKIHLEEIVRRKPNWGDMPMVYLHLGDYYRENNDRQKAADYYLRAATFSEDWKTHFGYDRLGAMQAEEENYPVALTYFCQAMQVNPESTSVKDHFNKALDLVRERYIKNPEFAYKDVVSGEFFKKSEEEKIAFYGKNCADDGCNYVFSPRFSKAEIVMPDLVSAVAENGEVVLLAGPIFNPATGQISFKVGAEQKNKELSFVFPTCDRIYYKVTVSPQ